MNALFKSFVIHSLALLLSVPAVFAQDRPAFSEQELDQMLAPVALYPDALLSQVLMASTYPLEVVQAARWSKSRPELKGEEAVKAVEPMDWEPSVKSLVAFPQVLHMMDEKLDWTERLGEAFLAQEPQVMETVQSLRRKALAAGQLRSNEQIRVTQQGDYIIIEPASPQLVYVPHYDPNVAYGSWGWPDYPPVYWAPPPGYYVASPWFTPGFLWTPGIVISAGFFFGHFDWPHRHVKVVKVVRIVKDHDPHTDFRVKRHITASDPTKIVLKRERVVWRHDRVHRRGVPFRHSAARREFSQSQPAGGELRRDFRGQDAAPALRHRDGERSADFRQVRPEGRTATVAPQAVPAAPGNTVIQATETRVDARVAPARADERARVITNREGRRPGSFRPATQGNDKRSESHQDRLQPRARIAEPQPMIAAPALQADVRPFGARANGNRNAPPPVTSELGSRAAPASAAVRRHGSREGGSVLPVQQSAARNHSGPRAGTANHRGQGGGKSQGGGGAHGRQTKGGKGQGS